MNSTLPIEVLKTFIPSKKPIDITRIIKHIYDTYTDECEEGLDGFLKHILKNKVDNMNIKDVIDLTFYQSCGNQDDAVPVLFHTYNQYLAIEAYKHLQRDDDDLRDYLEEDTEELFSIANGRIAVTTILPLWLNTKQIYKLDKDFTDNLIFTENLELSRDMIEHLPYDHFYLDFSDNDYDYKGAFVNVFKEKEEVKFSIILCMYINKKPATIGAQWRFKYNENDLLEIDSSIEDSSLTEKVIAEEFNSNENNGYVLSDKQETDRRVLNSLCFQIMCYLSSEEPDIYSEPHTISNGKKNKRYIKNDLYTDINIDNVGVRFGNTFRKEMKKYNTSNPISNTDKKSRKTVAPHLRRAHWSHYWVGKGRTKCVTRWIKPTFVVGMPNDAVIHKVS